MIQQLYNDIRTYFECIPQRTEAEQSLLDRMNEGFFPITTVHRDDLASKGFDVRGISDGDMETLAGEMADAYCTNCFWEDMEIIAEDLDFPQHPHCPKCKNRLVEYDQRTNSYSCNGCGQQWSNSYTLVEDPEETDQLPDDLGYPSSEAQNSNARFIPEYDYIRIFGKDPEPDSYYKPVPFPESQQYMPDEEGNDSILALNELINDEQGIEDFGTGAVWVPHCNLK